MCALKFIGYGLMIYRCLSILFAAAANNSFLLAYQLFSFKRSEKSSSQLPLTQADSVKLLFFVNQQWKTKETQ